MQSELAERAEARSGVDVIVGTWNVENLFCPGGQYGPRENSDYRAKLAALADTINGSGAEVLGLQEIGDRRALADLVDLLHGGWHTALSARFDPHRTIRVAVISRWPLQVVADVADFARPFEPVQVDDEGRRAWGMGRGAIAIRIEPPTGMQVDVAVCHLKSKLLSFPGTRGSARFAPRDEGERARYAGYALHRRAAEALTVRALTDQLLDGQGRTRHLVVCGDLNDEPAAATTQILYGPPGSELGTAGAKRPDAGDGSRLWNLAPLIPEDQRYTRVYRGRGELIDHILVSHATLNRIEQVRAVHDRALPSIDEDPTARRDARDSDHAPLLAHISF